MSNFLTTAQLAEKLGVQSGTIRKGLCLNGHYLGLVPVKLPNGQLRFDKEPAERLLEPEQGA